MEICFLVHILKINEREFGNRRYYINKWGPKSGQSCSWQLSASGPVFHMANQHDFKLRGAMTMFRLLGQASLWILHCENVGAPTKYYEINKFSIDWDDFDRWICLCNSNKQTQNMAELADYNRSWPGQRIFTNLELFFNNLIEFQGLKGVHAARIVYEVWISCSSTFL